MGLFAGAGIRVLRCTYFNSLLMPVALVKFRLWEPLLRKPPAKRRAARGALAGPSPVRAARHGGGAGLARKNFPVGQSLLLIGEKML